MQRREAGLTVDKVASSPVLGPREFDWIRRFLFQRTGIELKDGKQTVVTGRLDRRLRARGMSSYGEYCRLLASERDPDENRMAVDLLTTNETYFFREPKHFELLRQIARTGQPWTSPLRVWSGASSSGEEAYSIAMTLADSLATASWQVVGTDISSRVVETAQRGLYPIEAAALIPERFLRKYCLKGKNDFADLLAIDRKLRAAITFRHANLLDPPADLGRFDVVFLRNVMIYFNTETKLQVLENVLRQLKPGGHLIISHSETLSGLGTGLTMIAPSVYQSSGGTDG